MSIFALIGSIFKPASDIIDELNVSDEERGIIANKLAEIESKVSIQMMSLQAKALEASAKIEVATQQYGNFYTRSVRPTMMLGSFIVVASMAFGFIPFNQIIAVGCFGFMGVYSGLRTYEKKGQ